MADDATTALAAVGVTDVTVTGIRLRGRTDDPINTSPEFARVGLRVTRCTNFPVSDGDFALNRPGEVEGSDLSV